MAERKIYAVRPVYSRNRDRYDNFNSLNAMEEISIPITDENDEVGKYKLFERIYFVYC